jgi:N-sulfoglucosamine sulfohydrolase
MEGKLDGPQRLMFQPNRPVEELYDTQADPFEIANLANEPSYAEPLQRLRGALDGWLTEVGDLGMLPEAEMVRRWYPDGIQPRTAPPVLIPICQENPGIVPAPAGGEFHAPLLIQLHCATQGASIAYQLDSPEGSSWLLYTGPIGLTPGKHQLRAKAIRIGYQESEEIRVEISSEQAL